MYVGTVSQIDAIIENLKSLSPLKLEMAADYIQRLTKNNQDQRDIVLARTSGSLPSDIADAIKREVEEGCEKIDERSW